MFAQTTSIATKVTSLATYSFTVYTKQSTEVRVTTYFSTISGVLILAAQSTYEGRTVDASPWQNGII